ncbi:MAG: cytochrome b N-terminal domain-containing protein [Planctomycetota bacterium]
MLRLAVIAASACVATGVFLSMQYAPTWAAAQPAVRTIQDEAALGWLLRGLHHWGGTLAILLAFAELARLFWHAQYRRPHHRPWVATVLLLLLSFGFAYTGYLLVGDERAYAGALVLEGVARSTPLVGEAVGDAVLGGPVVASALLARLYTVHIVVLPMLLLAWIVAAARREKTTASGFVAGAAKGGTAVLGALAALAFVWPPAIGEIGQPGKPPAADAQPEWFFLWVNELLHRVDGFTFLIGGVLPVATFALILFLPWIARNGTRRAEVAVAGVLAVIVVSLSALAATREVDPEFANEEDASLPIATDDTNVLTDEQQAGITAALKKFRCARCHVIDGDPEGGEDGPPIPRGERFTELYTRAYFKAKIGDPEGFWADTGMYYPRGRKPNEEELALLELYFYGSAR